MKSLVLLVALAIVGAPLTADAQPAGKVYRVALRKSRREVPSLREGRPWRSPP